MSRRHKPTAEQRRICENAVAMGLDQEAIGKLLGVSGRTLRKCYRAELDTGLLKLVSKIGERLIDKIDAGDKAAIFFFLKCRLGWRENDPAAVNATATAQSAATNYVLRVPYIEGDTDAEIMAKWNELARRQQQISAEMTPKLGTSDVVTHHVPTPQPPAAGPGNAYPCLDGGRTAPGVDDDGQPLRRPRSTAKVIIGNPFVR